MINTQWLEQLPMSRINFHGPKDVRAIEVLLYNVHIFHKCVESENISFLLLLLLLLLFFENFEYQNTSN